MMARSVRFKPGARIWIAFAASLLLLVGATPAPASIGAYRVIVVQANCEEPTEIEADIAAFPDVAAVDAFDACSDTPSTELLEQHDLVVSMSNSTYVDQSAYGNALADFVDAGGVVVQFAYDNWAGNSPGDFNGPTGRFAAGGYEPFIPGDNPNSPAELGEFDASSPLMEGVSALKAVDNTAPQPAPGATVVAKWNDGRNLIAEKGHVVSVSAFVGNEDEWDGDFGRLVVNAVRVLGPQRLSVENPAPGRGSAVASPTELICSLGGFGCSADFVQGTPATVTAIPVKGFAFAGFTGDCVGPTCAPVMDTAKTVLVNFDRFAPIGKVKRNRKRGKAWITIRAGGPGTLVLRGKRVKARKRTVAAASNVRLSLAAKGKALRALRRTGRAKLGFKVTFRPANGLPASFARKLTLLRAG